MRTLPAKPLSKTRAAAAYFKALLSGLVSATADNDPTTVGTVAVAGATTAYGLEWMLVLIMPMLMIVQVTATHLAAVTHQNLQQLVRRRYGPAVAIVSMLSIVAVNAVTAAADIGAGAASLQLLSGVAGAIWVVPLAVLLGVLLTVETFDRVRAVFAILPLAFFAYAAAAFMAHPNWHDVARGFIPQISAKQGVLTVLALLGTLLTAYMYLWQTVEIAADKPPRRVLRRVKLASLPGVLFMGAVLLFILIATAGTLGVHHHPIETAQDAALALAPFAGRFAPIVFGIGLLGSSLLAVPVIAASSASAVCATFSWHGSLDDRPKTAPAYYGVLYGTLGLGALLTFSGVPTITLLYIASIAGGIATPVTLALLMLLARDPKTVRQRKISGWLAACGWVVTLIVSAAAIGSAFASLG